MTKSKIKPFLGKMCLISWRDPQGDSSWTGKPLGDKTVAAQTLGWPVGFNKGGEMVEVGTKAEDGDVADRNAIPVGLITDIQEVVLKKNARNR